MNIIVNGPIRFPNLGINLENLGTGINVLGFEIAYYGIIIALGMACGYFIVEWQAARTGQNKDIYLDFALWGVSISVVGARIYYVVLEWDNYKNNLWQIFNLRGGGLAIYGGILAAILTALVYTRVKRLSFWLLADTGCIGLITGQIIGRWGNFFNREAFGAYTNNLFAMQLDLSDVGGVYTCSLQQLEQLYTNKPAAFARILEIRDNIQVVDGISFIQVHPTFLYESIWNLLLLLLLLFYTKHKKFDGELVLLYLAGYGLGRIWIEGLRTDQLFLWGTGLAASQILSIILFLFSTILIIWKNATIRRDKKYITRK